MKAALPSKPPWLPLAGIFLSLAALLVVPTLIGRQGESIQGELLETTVPATRLVEALRISLADELFLRSSAEANPDHGQRIRAAAARRAALWLQISAMSPRLDPPTRARIEEVRPAMARWERYATSTVSHESIELNAAYTDATRGIDRVAESLEDAVALRRDAIGDLGRLEFATTALLAILAAASALVTARLNRRVSQFALESERAREEQRVLLESSGDGVFGVGPDGFCTFMNPAGEALIGYTPREVVGRPLHALIHHSRADGSPFPAEECHALRAIRSGTALHVEDETLWRKDGTSFLADCTTSPIVQHGELRGAVIAIRDVTQRVEVERERAVLLAREQHARAHAEAAERRAKFLAEASELFATSLEVETTLKSLSMLVVPRIADSCIIYLVDAAGEIQRLEPNHIDPERQRILAEQLDRYPPKLDSLIPPVRRALIDGETSVLQEVSTDALKALPGDESHTSIIGAVGLQYLVVTPLRARGRILGAISYGLSDSRRRYGPEERMLAEELAGRAALAIDNARLYQQSQAAVAARNEVLGIVSHDLRNPLNVVRMGTKSLLRYWPPEGDGDVERRQLVVIQKSSERMHRLIRDLLDLAQIDSGRFILDAERTSARTLLEDTREMLAPIAEENSIRVRVEIAPGVPHIWGDDERLVQVLQNLGANAVRFSPPGKEVVLSARADGDAVVFSVLDSGPGIAPEAVPHVFDRFWQAKNRRQGGAGLGLAIARGIVEGHGGRIWVESETGSGSAFHFTVPLADPPREDSVVEQLTA